MSAPKRSSSTSWTRGYTKGTKLDRDAPFLLKPIIGVMKAALARTPKEAAWTYVDGLAVKGKESHGSFLYNWEVFP